MKIQVAHEHGFDKIKLNSSFKSQVIHGQSLKIFISKMKMLPNQHFAFEVVSSGKKPLVWLLAKDLGSARIWALAQQCESFFVSDHLSTFHRTNATTTIESTKNISTLIFQHLKPRVSFLLQIVLCRVLLLQHDM